MESMNPFVLHNNIKEKYLSFILTTICRNNQELYDELKNIFLYQLKK